MEFWLGRINEFVWGAPALVLILGVGAWLCVRTRFAQIRLFPESLRAFFEKLRKDGADGVSPFQALCTALAATVGTGNLVGVAGAIALGGPGSIFWMWICALFGMMIKFAEAALAVRYREQRAGEYVAGPMYVIRNGLEGKWSFLAGIYSFLGIVAALGVGNAVQINAVISGINGVIRGFGGSESFRGNLIMALLLALLVGTLVLGGAGRIGRTAELLMPVLSVSYMLLCIGVLVVQYRKIPVVLESIVIGAFSPGAVTGGVVGSWFSTLRIGVSRGVFTNEAGMGTAGIAHGAADVSDPAEQGLMGIMEVFLDTVVICTLTALVILCSGVDIEYGKDLGGLLTEAAFCAVYGDWVRVFLAAALCCFAFGTILGWGLYGIRCCQFLFGDGSRKWFSLAQIGVSFLGAMLQSGTVWVLAEIVNGIMAIPNLIALVALTPELRRLVTAHGEKREKPNPGRGFSQIPLTKRPAK